MELSRLNQLIDEALKEGEKRRGAMPQTNVLNAEFSLGKYFAYLFLIEDVYGIDEMIKTKDRTQDKIDELTLRTQEIY